MKIKKVCLPNGRIIGAAIEEVEEFGIPQVGVILPGILDGEIHWFEVAEIQESQVIVNGPVPIYLGICQRCGIRVLHRLVSPAQAMDGKITCWGCRGGK